MTLLEILQKEFPFLNVEKDEFMGGISINWPTCSMRIFPTKEVSFATDELTKDDAITVSAILTTIANHENND